MSQTKINIFIFYLLMIMLFSFFLWLIYFSYCTVIEGIKIKERTPDDILKELVDNTREQLRREELRLEKNKRLDEKIKKINK